MKKFILGVMSVAAVMTASAQDLKEYVIFGKAEGANQVQLIPQGNGDQNCAVTIANPTGTAWESLSIAFNQEGGAGWTAVWLPIPTSEFDPRITTQNDCTIEFEVKTTWEGELKFKAEYQGGGPTQEGIYEMTERDGEFHKVSININDWLGQEKASQVKATTTFCPSFVTGPYDADANGKTIEYRNVVLKAGNDNPIEESKELEAAIEYNIEPVNSTSCRFNYEITLKNNVEEPTSVRVWLDAPGNVCMGEANTLKGSILVEDMTGTMTVWFKSRIEVDGKTINALPNDQGVDLKVKEGGDEPISGGNEGTVAAGADGWQEIASPGGEQWAPTIDYAITYNADKTLSIRAEVANQPASGTANVEWFTPGREPQFNNMKRDGNVYTFTTTNTYELGDVIAFHFRCPVEGGLSMTKPLSYEVGSVTAIESIEAAVAANVDVISLTGVVVRANVAADNATEGLPAGIYIVDGKKVLVR